MPFESLQIEDDIIVIDNRKEPTLRRTRLLKPVLEVSDRLSFILTHKDLLLYRMLDKAGA